MDPRFQQLIELLTGIAERAQQVTTLNKSFTTDMGRATNVDTAKNTAKVFQNALTPLIDADLKAAAEALDLAKQLSTAAGTAPFAPTPTRAEAIAKHFRTLVQAVQLDARQPTEGQLATTLKSFDVEIKGLIVVENNEAQIVTPVPGAAIDPAQLSTIRMSFGSIPGLVVREAPGTAPTR